MRLLLPALLLMFGATALGSEPGDDVDALTFSHAVHASDNAIPCTFCHTGVERSTTASIPPLQTCVGCHETVARERPAIQALLKRFEEKRDAVWTRVYELPSTIYFSHRRHVGAGETCETCHGDVAKMTLAEPAVDHTMAWCLDCHRERVAPVDCVGCHK